MENSAKLKLGRKTANILAVSEAAILFAHDLLKGYE